MTLLETTRPSLGRDTENVRPFIVASPEPGSAPLTLRAISKRWRHGMPPVLDDVSLSLKPGTTTCIGGRNGVGKTTLLRICAGLIEPECGRAEVWGFTARENRAQYQRLVSLLSAGDRGLYARLSVRHHLDFCARIAMVPREQLGASVEDALNSFDLHALADRRVDRLSMGQRQRLRIAMTFLPQPEVVLLDEPLTSLDHEGGALLREASAAVQARGGTVLWCSPSAEHASVAFDACWTLEHGRLTPA